MSSSPKKPRRKKPSESGRKTAPARKKTSQSATKKRTPAKSTAKSAKKATKKTARKAAAKPVKRRTATAKPRSQAKKPAAKAPAMAKKPAATRRGRVRMTAAGGDEVTFASRLPLLPLRDVVIFPGMIVPLLVGRPASVAAVERGLADDKFFAVLTQRDPQDVEPSPEALHNVGTVVRTVQVLRMPDGSLKVLVEGIGRFRAGKLSERNDYLEVSLKVVNDQVRDTPAVKALMRGVIRLFQEYVTLHHAIPDEMAAAVDNIEDPRATAYVVAGHLLLDLDLRQALLSEPTVPALLRRLSQVLGDELEILRLERKIEGEVRTRVSKGQKEFYLQEQLKAIRKELGESLGDEDHDGEDLREQVERSGMPAAVKEKTLKEVERLQRMSSMSPEATVVRSYVETLLALPWAKRSRDRLDLEKAATILDEDHYGLTKVKDRILEYLAVVKLVKRPRGSILCLVGPPGVGKTSLGKSVARALGRKFVRVALGGVRDEAEIRGHRRTYIGSMPGRIIQGIKRAGTKNPVFLLDEVDKLSSDFRGDPSSALLEVLDPEQNKTFNDHYLDVDFDLSEVLFITTANVLPAIPPALRDRMEILRLPGYLEHEKMGIASRFLLRKQIKEHGLTEKDLVLSEDALQILVTRYTREAGVRNLERELATLCRKVAREKVTKARKTAVRIGVKNLEKYLGAPRFPERRLAETDRVGVGNGLAWTEYGGDVLPVEVSVVPGSGKIAMTGRMGEVMRESVRIALTYVRRRAGGLGLSPDFAEQVDVHLHMPEGAIPKDGPSAGVCIATAVISALLRVPIRRDVAMTGEITLLGQVLPIGGLNEKAVAASLAGYQHIIVPKQNEPDWEEVSSAAKKTLTVTFVDHVDDALRHALVPSPAVDRLLGAPGEPPPAEGLGLPGIAH
ncbi:MAG: Lon protease [Gemmatimonadota bacterium]|nr:MAG: Lon protease [Gemmatimonadota bacterium]